MKTLSIIGYVIQSVVGFASFAIFFSNQTIGIGLMFLLFFIAFIQEQIELRTK